MRYPLLLMELLSATPESHPDRAPLAAAVLAVKEINGNLNEYKRRKDLGELQVNQHRNNTVNVDKWEGAVQCCI